MSSELQAKARAFLERPIPVGMSYQPGSLSEQFIVTYAADGTFDLNLELTELLGLCIREAFDTSARRAGEEANFFRESASILQAIQAESTASRSCP